MIVRPLAEVLQMTDGEQISSVRGTVTNIYKRNNGTNTHGEWSMQNLILKEGTTEMKVVIKDRPALPQTLKGKVLVIQSNMGDRGMSGIKANDNEYPKGSGKVSREIYVTPSAHLLTEAGEITDGCTSAPLTGAAPAANPAAAPAAASPAPAATTHQSTPQGASAAPTGTATATGKEQAVADLRKFLGSRGNIWALCRMTIQRKAEQVEAKSGKPVSEDAIQAGTASLFISVDRSAQFHDFPSCDLSNFLSQ